jgi:hypothetical protein
VIKSAPVVLLVASAALLANGTTLHLSPTSDSVLEIRGTQKQAVLRFDLHTLPADVTVLSARLLLTLQPSSGPPIPPKRFAIAESENHIATLTLRTPGDHQVDVARLIRGKSALTLTISGEANSSATIVKATLEIHCSGTAPQANAGGEVFAPPGHVGPILVNGSNSALPGGRKAYLKYQWTIAKPAAGSPYKSGDELGHAPLLSFTPRTPGYYLLKLKVTNPATGESTEDTAAVLTALRPHPRLQVDDEVLAQIRALRDAKDPLWTRFYQRLKSPPPRMSPANQSAMVTGGLLASLVTGEKELFDSAWSIAATRLYKNKTDRSGGVIKLIDYYKGDQHTAAFQGGQYIGQMALMYDWGYAHLTPEQRQDLVAWLNEAVTYNYLYSRAAHEMFRNDGASFTYGLAAATYATLDENPEGHKLLGWFRATWDEVVQVLDIMGKGGAAGEGNAYGASPTASSLIRAANVVYYASGEDLFSSHVWFKQRLLYDAFAAYPGTIGGPDSPARYPDAPIVEQASIDGDGRRGASWHSGALRPNGLILARRFAGTPEADTWNWVYRQPAVDHGPDGGDPVNELLYYTPRPKLVKPTKLSFFDPSMGFVYIRSDWDSPDATWIAFWAGPHLDTHQHLDQGGFAIFKRRDLAPKTGHYDDDSIRSPHGLAWYTRTISANTLLIGDPSEIFRGFNAGMGCDGKGNGSTPCPPNDGGQRTMYPLPLAVQNAEAFEAYREVFDVARVVSFEDDGQSVSVVADITNAYNSPRYSTAGNRPKVNKVWRRLVYLRQLDVLLIADTVESTDPKFEKKWLIHALDRIEVGRTPGRTPRSAADALVGPSAPANESSVAPGESVYAGVDEARIVVDDADRSDKNQTTFDLRKGYAALLMKTLFPTGFHYRKVGGREPADTHRHIRDFWVKDFSEGVIPNHESRNWPPVNPIENAAKEYIPVFGPGYGRWRLEVEPGAPAQTDFFLNIVQPTLDPNAKLPPIEKLETADTFGVAIKTYRVVFSKNSLARPTTEPRASASGLK